jgi:putative peptidoglycan lipid II flippase
MIKEPLQARYLWLFVFCFATVTSLLFQKFLLPQIPSLHGGSGLLLHDATFYHESAIFLANKIHTYGWSAWSAWSEQTNTTGNVAVLSALYAAFSPDPALIIPVNAFFHAAGALMVLLIGREIFPGRVGNIAGLVAATLFAVFPSSLSWYSQPLKDSYVIAGMLLILYTWLRALSRPLSAKKMLILLAWLAVGVALVAFVKPYYLRLLLVVAVLATGAIVLPVLRKERRQRYQILTFFLMATAIIGFSFASVTHTKRAADTVYADWKDAAPPSIKGREMDGDEMAADLAHGTSGAKGGIEWEWQDSPWLAKSLEKYLEIPARTRAAMIRFNQKVGADSMIDANVAPKSTREVILYLPRALQIALFAPFPDSWAQKRSVPRLIAIAETLLWYLIAPGLLFALYYRRSLALMVTLLFALCFLTVFSFVTPNVGSLYRYRYAYEFLLIVVGVGGWIQFFLNRRAKEASRVTELEPTDASIMMAATDEVSALHTSKKRLISVAVIVSLLTLTGSLGFFARDLFMVRWFGAGNEMDIFFLGAMIPMFFVAVLAIPAGTAFIPAYSTLQRDTNPAASAQLLGSAVLYLSLLLAVVSVLLYFFAPYLFALMNWQYSNEKLAAIHQVMNVYLLILMLGGLIIIANAVLNAEGGALFPAAAQVVVPAIAFLSLLLFGRVYGIYAVVYGMLAGQFGNLLLVAYVLWRRGVLSSMRPNLAFRFTDLPLNQYAVLLAAALSTALFVPVANGIAANLSPGSVALIGLGTKVVLLITGVIGIGMTTVLLPYFSSLAAKLHHQQAKSDLSFFLLFVTLLSVPTALAMVVLVAPMTRLVFANSALTQVDTLALIRVIQYGVIQLPFFTCGLVAIKYITAYQRTGIIMLSALVNLVLTILLGMIFGKIFGVGGISLAMTLSMAVSTALLVVYATHLKHLPSSDGVFIVLNWAIFLTLFACLHFQVYFGVVICSFIYLMLVTSNWHALIKSGLNVPGRGEIL